jgi:putative hydrolase of the HAD superfamily
MLQAITFDFWGTLVDASFTYTAERVATLCSMLPDWAPGRVLSAYREGEAGIALVDAHGLHVDVRARLSLTLDALGAALSPADYESTVRRWEETLLDDPPTLLEGVPATLEAMRERGMRLALISDTGYSPGRVLRQALERRGIRQYFQRLTFSDELGVTKRRPQGFRSTLQALGVTAAQALHVGDTPATDLQGAHAAGLRAALLLQNNRHLEGIPQADVVLERISELPEAIARLER